jgi:hypothetical protein
VYFPSIFFTVINLAACDENEIRLQQDLMANYSKTRPSDSYSDRLDVELTLSLTNIISIVSIARTKS